MDLSIVIVNYNTSEHLRSCLASIYKYTENIEFEVIIVDNNSPKRDIEDFDKIFPQIRLYLRKENDGFGAGCNFGAGKSKGKHIAFINPDVVINSNLFKGFYDILESNPVYAVIAPVYLESDGTESKLYRELPGYLQTIAEAFGSFTYDFIRKLFPLNKENPIAPFETTWVYGSFIYIKKSVYDEVKGFDEDFFLYFEDIDLQYRIGKSGYIIQYHPGFKINHYERSSIRSYHGENLYYYHMTRSYLLYMYKHFSFVKRSILRVIAVIGIFWRAVTIIFRKDYSKKRMQKYSQLYTKLCQYTYSENKLKNGKYYNFTSHFDDREQIIHKDKFWN